MKISSCIPEYLSKPQAGLKKKKAPWKTIVKMRETGVRRRYCTLGKHVWSIAQLPLRHHEGREERKQPRPSV